MRCRVIALDVLTARTVRVSRDAISHGKFFFRYDAMCDQSGNGIIRTAHVGKMHGALIVPEFSNVGDLSARFRVKGRVIEDNFAFRASWQFVYYTFLGDDSFDAAIFCGRTEIKIRLSAKSFREFAVDWIC